MPPKLLVMAIAAWLGSATVTETPHSKWQRVQIREPVARHAAIAALESAAARFQDSDCLKVLNDFQTITGWTPAAQLAAWETDIETYLPMVVFIDDSRHRVCEKGKIFFTSPGSRVVRACVENFKSITHHSPGYLAALVIHEVLHTLGLGESPPSSEEITARVMKRCGSK